jgi:hypothetical protein
MTETDKTIDPVDVVARALLANDPEYGEHLELLEALRLVVTHNFFVRLCRACEVCPVHICDAQICVDDYQPDCDGGNGYFNGGPA